MAQEQSMETILRDKINTFCQKYFENINVDPKAMQSDEYGDKSYSLHYILSEWDNGRISLWCDNGWEPYKNTSIKKDDIVFSLALERDIKNGFL